MATPPACTWLLRLSSVTDYPNPHHYCLTNGRVVAREQPLNAGEAIILTEQT